MVLFVQTQHYICYIYDQYQECNVNVLLHTHNAVTVSQIQDLKIRLKCPDGPGWILLSIEKNMLRPLDHDHGILLQKICDGVGI